MSHLPEPDRAPDQAEELLAGGNSTTVVRRGETVRRTAGPWTPTVQALLRHLRAQGVTEVPEPLGTDDQGREVLSFLTGDVAHYPLPEWVWDESVLRDAGALLRRVHDASVGFLAAGGAPAPPVWQTAPHEPAEVVCHNDVAPYNLVFRDGVVVGLIDFDTASPGPRIWDLAYLGYRLAPLVADAAEGEGGDAVGRLDPLARLDTLVCAYGMPYSRREVLTVVVARLDELAAFTDERAAATGRDDFRAHATMYRADARRVQALADASPR
ncbi:phosphotransferase enzyme family protein [Oerskovia sp. USHLN155]|uniref:phosphotransferase enzyme family protein n=1 Tax=Oerskovia sp. USHLN155 TaxID=3081288 RepID=UPI00301A6787